MPSFLLMPDSFKGTLSAPEVCAALNSAVSRVFPEAPCRSMPVADGGEGTVQCLTSALQGSLQSLQVSGPFLEPVQATYGLLHEGSTAVLEIASCASLPMVIDRQNPALTTTYGLGEQLVHAAEHGVKSIVVGLGGSCTNDGGCGMAAACGVKFFDRQGQEFVPAGGTLQDIVRIDMSCLHPALRQVQITAMCDIDNPLYGPQGAAFVYAPQKGASPELVQELDAGLRHLAAVWQDSTGQDIASLPGSGAAGGLGFGMQAFLGAKLQSGIATVLDVVHFEDMLQDDTVILTGEGRFDGQSLSGKVISGITRRAAPKHVPVLVFAGGCEDSCLAQAYREGVTAVFSICRKPQTLAESAPFSAQNLTASVENALRVLALGMRAGSEAGQVAL